MKDKFYKIGAALVFVATLGIVSMPIIAKAETEEEVAEVEAVAQNTDTLTTGDLSQTEVVYAKYNNLGERMYYSARESLKNTAATGATVFKTGLLDLQNLNGINSISLEGGVARVETGGENLVYSGIPNTELPISFEISYYFDGRLSDVNEMVGKSGKVRTVFEFKNLSRDGEVFTPFTVALASSLSDECADIEVTNGAVSTNGELNLVAAVVMPGLAESLELSELESLNKIEISYDTSSFEIPSYYLVATPKLLEKADLSMFDKLDGVFEKVDLLSNATSKLEDGSAQLYSGIEMLSGGLSQLSDNSEMLRSGSSQISDAISKIDSVVSELESKYNELNKDGAVDEVLAKLKEKLAILEEYSKKLANLTSNVDNLMSDVEDIKKTVVLHCANLTEESPTEMVEFCMDLQKLSDSISDESKEKIAETIEMTKRVLEVISQEVPEYIAKAEELLDEMPEKVSSAVSNVHLLNEGASKLNSGISMYTGAVDKAASGSKQLLSGASMLKTGIQQFDEQGISKIVDLVNNSLKSKTARVKKLVELSQDYQSYIEGHDESIETWSTIIMLVDSEK